MKWKYWNIGCFIWCLYWFLNHLITIIAGEASSFDYFALVLQGACAILFLWFYIEDQTRERAKNGS